MPTKKAGIFVRHLIDLNTLSDQEVADHKKRVVEAVKIFVHADCWVDFNFTHGFTNRVNHGSIDLVQHYLDNKSREFSGDRVVKIDIGQILDL